MSADVTALLSQWRSGDEQARAQLIEAVYAELRRIAAVSLRREANARTLQPTALVNELCLKMLAGPAIDCNNRAHFLAIASQQMRRLLVDHARKRLSSKRGSGRPNLALNEAHDRSIAIDGQIEDIHEALTGLEKLDPRAASIVEMRFFGGLTEPEIAEALDLSVATVKRDWEFARSWLLARLEPAR